MKIIKSHLEDCCIIEYESFADKRGTFTEVFNAEKFKKLRLPIEWAQDNISYSTAHVLRGFHIQTKNPQGKLVRCIKGEILDVAMDLRPESPTFKQWHMVKLDERNNKAFWIPPGFAHGLYSLTDSVVYYKCTTLYDKKSDGGVNPLKCKDITWPSRNVIVSDKDKNLPTIEEWLRINYGTTEQPSNKC